MTSEQVDLSRRYLEFLDWPDVCAELAQRAHSSRGVSACQTLPLCDSAEEARERMAEVTEAVEILRMGEACRCSISPRSRSTFARSVRAFPWVPRSCVWWRIFAKSWPMRAGFWPHPARRGVADAAPLVAWRPRSATTRIWCTWRARPSMPRASCATVLRPSWLACATSATRLPRRARAQADRSSARRNSSPFLQDQFVTLREDRFVLPLRASFKSMGLGIVHDTSRTGETVFVEPTALVELNNRLKVAEIEIRRESRRILQELAAAVSAAAPLLRTDRETLARLDVIGASARLAQAYQGMPVEIVDEPIVELASCATRCSPCARPARSGR
jgi:dsDNA-specific endonuclease/ATPase MutS2